MESKDKMVKVEEEPLEIPDDPDFFYEAVDKGDFQSINIFLATFPKFCEKIPTEKTHPLLYCLNRYYVEQNDNDKQSLFGILTILINYYRYNSQYYDFESLKTMIEHINQEEITILFSSL